ncbi:zinc-finger domain-containing protein [Ottowia sp. GY511]|uniref:Zinc-finger domain-containing protein n=1 Tax=Ottowia flava TaxID=2675430 RepID=A0ABW4L1T4_9BURK|nr:zinc-finger domain-containing protein [Ottowia sp. GY511]TXK27312.1 zinc-finger domain-containing protein [Ottowia sp. GY511]
MSTTTPAPVILLAKDLTPQGGVFCPNPLAKMELWNAHPKVYLDVAHTGQARCPYCGTLYQLKAGEHVASH